MLVESSALGPPGSVAVVRLPVPDVCRGEAPHEVVLCHKAAQGNRPDTGPTPANKNTFSATVMSQKKVVVQKS